MDHKFKELIIFTGAGFTKNYGGFLAEEMWARIFNDPKVQASARIRALLENDFDFERVYSNVFDGPVSYTDEERNILRESIEKAYKNLDDAIRGWVQNDDNPTSFNSYGLTDLTNLLNGGSNEKGLFVTLNQDLLMERQYQWRWPGVNPMGGKFYQIHGIELDQSDFVRLPATTDLQKIDQDIQSHVGIIYIKLHGSYGWLTADGTQQMVLGKNKPEAIEKEPLLKRYFDIFQTAIKEGNRKMLIIGYRFQDEHINKILLEGVGEFGLKIYIINPNSPSDFKDYLDHYIHYALPLWSSVRGYYPYTLKQIFSPNQEKTIMLKEIIDSLQSS